MGLRLPLLLHCVVERNVVHIQVMGIHKSSNKHLVDNSHGCTIHLFENLKVEEKGLSADISKIQGIHEA